MGSLGKQSLLKTQNLTSEEFNSYAAYYKNVWGRIGKQPLIINSQGNSKKAEIALGPNTDLSEGCGVTFNNEFFVFGGEFENQQFYFASRLSQIWNGNDVDNSTANPCLQLMQRPNTSIHSRQATLETTLEMQLLLADRNLSILRLKCTVMLIRNG